QATARAFPALRGGLPLDPSSYETVLVGAVDRAAVACLGDDELAPMVSVRARPRLAVGARLATWVRELDETLHQRRRGSRRHFVFARATPSDSHPNGHFAKVHYELRTGRQDPTRRLAQAGPDRRTFGTQGQGPLSPFQQRATRPAHEDPQGTRVLGGSPGGARLGRVSCE